MPDKKVLLKIGLLTDVHYAESEPRGTRYYRESLPKMREAAARLKAEKIDFAICVGDLIDTPQPPDPAKEMQFLRTIAAAFADIRTPRYFVLGNHCVAGIPKDAYLKTVGQARSYYSFDRNGIHCIVLDGCFRADGVAYAPGNFSWKDSEIPAPQRDWLAADLASTKNPTLVFVHQRLDNAPKDCGVHSSEAVRAILEKSGKVRAVFQGHSHKNDCQTVGNIPYITLVAMIEGSGPENNGYSVLSVHADGTLTLQGFRRQAEYVFPPVTKT